MFRRFRGRTQVCLTTKGNDFGAEIGCGPKKKIPAQKRRDFFGYKGFSS